MFDNKELIHPASKVNYADADEIYAYHLLLGKLYERYGGMSYPSVSSPTLRALDAEARVWLKKTEEVIDSILQAPMPPKNMGALGTNRLSIKHIQELLEGYDLIYRLSRQSVPKAFINAVREKTIKRWLSGDKSLSGTQFMLLLWSMITTDIRNADKRYCDYCISMQSDWVQELLQYGRFRQISNAEAYQRLKHLLRQDLFAYVAGGKAAQEETKKQWAEAYKVDDISALDTPTLRSYIAFERTATLSGYLPCADPDSQYEILFSELASRPDLHPFHREALRIELETHQLLSCG